MKKKLLIVLTIFVSLFVLTACNEVEDTTLAGTYNSVEHKRGDNKVKDNDKITLIINDDNTAVIKYNDKDEFQMKYDDKKIYFVEAEGEYYEYSKKDKELTLNSAGEVWTLIKE